MSPTRLLGSLALSAGTRTVWSGHNGDKVTPKGLRARLEPSELGQGAAPAPWGFKSA